MFGRVRQWAIRHKVLVDAIVIAPFLLFSIVPVLFVAPAGISRLGYAAISMALLAPLAFRRKYPVAVFAVVSVTAFAQWLITDGPIPADVGILVAMFTVAAHCQLAWGLVALAVAELGAVLAMADWFTLSFDTWPPSSIFVLALWIAGLYVNMRRSYLTGLEERAEQLERERDARAQAAAAEERERIAREMHDVVAHNVSVMVVQADGASYAIDHSPETAKRAVETISHTGREALTEMRRLLGVLRGGDGAHGTPAFAPQPGIDELANLVGQVRATGLPVELAVEGAPRPMDYGAGLAAYRIAQEALTNTLKHGGPAARAWVRVRYGDGFVEMRIEDDGRGPGMAYDGADGNRGSGHGLVGMRERAGMLGGRLEAGPRTGGGYRVVATLPTEAG